MELELRVAQMSGRLEHNDRQGAWELYCELVSRRAVCGPLTGEEGRFQGELVHESLDSVYAFFQRARELMKRYPGTKTAPSDEPNVSSIILWLLDGVLRPFLGRWHGRYRHWWSTTDPKLDPFERQAGFREYETLIADWSAVREQCRETVDELVSMYGLVDVREDLLRRRPDPRKMEAG